MCLLVVAFGVVPDHPLVVAANRDKHLDRPAVPMTVLRAGEPRTLGGRDQKAGGTWLAVNARGVFAGLTNQPRPDGRDDTKRSRGELPLAVTQASSAAAGIDALLDQHRPSDYNGAWLLAGDRDSLFSIDFTGDTDPAPLTLGPGLHVLENRPLREPSPKSARVANALGTLAHSGDTVGAMQQALADHTPSTPDAPDGRTGATCVHLDGYGTRSACILDYPSDPGAPPWIWVADGPPCTAAFRDVSSLWAALPDA
jgi:uncharacterized protein with NRDE domain